MKRTFSTAISKKDADRGQPVAPIRKILAVGVDEGACVYGGKNGDSADLTKFIDFLIKEGLVALNNDGTPDIEIGDMNLDQGHDFLKNPRECDLLYISFVYGFEGEDKRVVAEQRQSAAPLQERFAEGTRRFLVSSDHRPENWKKAVAASNPKIVFTVGGRTEVATQHICSDRFDVIQPSTTQDIHRVKYPSFLEIWAARGFKRAFTTHPKMGDHGIPSPHFGVLFDVDYTKLITTSGASLTALKKRLLDISTARAAGETVKPIPNPLGGV